MNEWKDKKRLLHIYLHKRLIQLLINQEKNEAGVTHK